MDYIKLSQRPFKLEKNRIRRPFKGGLLLDKWQGVKPPEDGYIPEEWVASIVSAVNPGPIENEGLSAVDVAVDVVDGCGIEKNGCCNKNNQYSTESGRELFLKDLIENDPQAFLGKRHFEKHGSNMGMLVKVLDSYSRLLIQVHPDKSFASEVFKSDFGKTEAWYIVGGRTINGEEPYVFFGFKPGITREKWIELFEKQDIKGMEDALHKIHVKPGDVFFVEGGVPHAAGAGVFFIEIQEPTDITIRTERKNLAGQKLSDGQLHQGIGFDRMFDCFHYDGYTKGEILGKWRLEPEIARKGPEGRVIDIIPKGFTPYFSMQKFEVEQEIKMSGEGTFIVAVVLSGSGKVIWDGGEMQLRQSDELFLPANTGEITWKSNTETKMEVVICYPPRS